MSEYTSIIAEGYNNNKYYEKYRKDRELTDTECMLLDRLCDRNKIGGGLLLLDIGCGDGSLFDSYLLSKGASVTGVDVSIKQIEAAERNNPTGTYLCTDFIRMCEYTTFYNGIICMYAFFHFINNEKAALQKMYNMLYAYGVCLINIRKERVEGVYKLPDWCGTEMCWTHPGVEQVVEWCKEVGFKVTVIDNPDNDEYIFLWLKKE